MARASARDPDEIGPEERILQVDPETLIESPFHHRTRWGDMRSFAKLIADQGMIQPIVVRPLAKPTRTARYEIVVGHRRKRGAIEGGLRQVPIVVREYEDGEVLEVQAIENMRREELHPLDEASYFAELLDKGSHDLRSLSKRFTRSPAYVTARLRLNSLSKPSRASYAKGEISDEAAAQVCKLATAAQQAALVGALKAGAITDDAIPSWIRRHALVTLADVPWPLADADLPGGACTTCPKRTGSKAQREIFEDIAGADDLCTDPRCWSAKMSDHATTTIGRMALEGHPLKTGDPSAVFLPTGEGRPLVVRSSGFLDAEADCPSVPGQTWLQAVIAAGGDMPKVTLMVDQDGRLRYLLEDKLAARVRRSVRDKPEGEAAKAEAAADPTRARVREHAAAVTRGEDDLVRAIMRAPAATSSDKLAALLVPIVIGHVVAASTTRRIARLTEREPDALRAGDPANAIAVLAALAVAEVGAKAPEVRDLAAAYGVDLPPAEL